MKHYKITILGCGSSSGVPSIEAGFGSCDPNNIKNIRSRTSSFLEIYSENKIIHSILFDTSPDFRMQALKNQIKSIDTILYTHAHADHIYGLDDIRSINRITKKEINCYASLETALAIEKSYDYIFNDQGTNKKIINSGTIISKPIIMMHKVEYNNSFYIRSLLDEQNISINTALQSHCKTKTMGFVIDNKVAYATDFHALSDYAFSAYKNIPLLIVSATVLKQHPSHATLEEVLEIIEKLNPKRAVIIHMSTEIDYDICSKKLPKNVELAYDGLIVNVY